MVGRETRFTRKYFCNHRRDRPTDRPTARLVSKTFGGRDIGGWQKKKNRGSHGGLLGSVVSQKTRFGARARVCAAATAAPHTFRANAVDG